MLAEIRSIVPGAIQMPTTTPKGRWQHLRHDDGSSVVITDEDGDRFVLPVKDVIRACRSVESIETFSQQFKSVMKLLSTWVDDNSSEIDRAFLTLNSDGVVFVVVRKGIAFDPNFEDNLSELDLRISNDESLDQIQLKVIALPLSEDDTVGSFIDLSKAWMAVIP